MPLQRFVGIAVLCAAVFGAATSAVAQALPDIYTLIDVGPVPAMACPCIAAPFSVPAHRPGSGYGGGPVTPGVDAPASESERQQYAAERAVMARDIALGRAGDAGASLSVGMHLAQQRMLAGDDPKVEEQAARWLHLAARQGNADAAMFLGYRYLRGKGVEESELAAAFWFHQAASDGNNVAMIALGLLHMWGRGVPQDPAAAVHWWQKARPTNAVASRFLGDAYVCGLGVPQDFARAALEYKSSANRGLAASSIQLGHMHANGCAEADDAEAVKAFRLAADEGYPEAQIALAELMLQGRAGSPAGEAYLWGRFAVWRLPPGELRTRAASIVTRAAASMVPEEIAGWDRMIHAMILEAATPRR
jgi:TPR repeat protein